jgi:hypothetical protein
MSLHNVSPGAKAPEEFNVIIEIPMNADPIKYEVDKESGALFVDRFLTTPMYYPCNYGYIPRTLADDGDPVDVLVITPFALNPGVVVTCRALGVLMMDDEAEGHPAFLRALQGPGSGQVGQGQGLGRPGQGDVRDHRRHGQLRQGLIGSRTAQGAASAALFCLNGACSPSSSR